MAPEEPKQLLLPQNRKLRHLRGISVRNLTLTRAPSSTTDDAALTKTPAKTVSRQESELQHAQSSDAINIKIRPSKPRRRSTIWAGQSTGYRQKKLEDVIDNGMSDSFFSLHCEGIDEPLYISELVKKAMNPSFRFFDLTNYDPAITRRSTLTVKYWVRRQEFILHLEQHLDMRSLCFLGKLEKRKLPRNCILFHLVDGTYALDLSSSTQHLKPSPPLASSSYSALMRLSRLEESIQDALGTREAIANQINEILRDRTVDESLKVQDEAAMAYRYLSLERKVLKQTIKRRADLKESLAARRQAMERGRKAQANAEEDVSSASDKLNQSQKLLQATKEQIHGQRRRICEELLRIFPIQSTSQPLLFTILGLPLPNTSFDDAEEEVVAAALGHTARLVDMLQYYTSVPLPYQITSFGSRSIIHDQISTLADSQRTFPLYIKGAIRYRFDYAVFLLNKDIERLAESQGLKVIDIRHTLPNLKYLLYICSAGNTELPARKAGGIRGLLSGRVTPLLSRRGSEEIEAGDAARKALEESSSLGDGDNRWLRRGPTAIVPTAPDKSTTLRTRGFREYAVR